jgi:hypothetical protein
LRLTLAGRYLPAQVIADLPGTYPNRNISITFGHPAREPRLRVNCGVKNGDCSWIKKTSASQIQSIWDAPMLKRMRKFC